MFGSAFKTYAPFIPAFCSHWRFKFCTNFESIPHNPSLLPETPPLVVNLPGIFSMQFITERTNFLCQILSWHENFSPKPQWMIDKNTTRLFYYRTKLENILLSDNNEHNVRCAYDELCYWPDPWQLGRDKRKKMFIRNIKHFRVLINLDRDTWSLEGSFFYVVFAIDLIRIKTIQKGSAWRAGPNTRLRRRRDSKVVIITNNNPVSN